MVIPLGAVDGDIPLYVMDCISSLCDGWCKMVIYLCVRWILCIGFLLNVTPDIVIVQIPLFWLNLQ